MPPSFGGLAKACCNMLQCCAPSASCQWCVVMHAGMFTQLSSLGTEHCCYVGLQHLLL